MRISDWSSDVCSSDLADDREIERRERNRIGEGNAHQPPETHAHAFEHVEFARRRKPSESEENPEHQADRNAERKIFGDEIREHPPHDADRAALGRDEVERSEEHTSALQSLMRISYAVFCFKKKN